jgi:hypothetical protein
VVQHADPLAGNPELLLEQPCDHSARGEEVVHLPHPAPGETPLDRAKQSRVGAVGVLLHRADQARARGVELPEGDRFPEDGRPGLVLDMDDVGMEGLELEVAREEQELGPRQPDPPENDKGIRSGVRRGALDRVHLGVEGHIRQEYLQMDELGELPDPLAILLGHV